MPVSRTTVLALFLVTCLSAHAWGDSPKNLAATPTPTPAPVPIAAAATKVSIDLTFVEPAGATLADRRVQLSLGTTETVSISQGGRTVSAELTVVSGTKAGCYRVDVTLRDKRVDATGHFNKTVWQSGSEPCGALVITLGPKEETRLRVGIKPLTR